MVYQTILASTLRYAIVAPAASQIPHCLGSTGAETPYSLRLLASVAVDSAAVVLDTGDTEVLRGALGGVDLTARMYPETMAVSVNVARDGDHDAGGHLPADRHPHGAPWQPTACTQPRCRLSR